ncbi:PPOX class F420-dependent oxidoreductase [Streptomonospora litoralis]|uniref:Pyridoxamine 5'-phosphate oxidase n=1 Tax=Streptomonospora litoralis TaxID=2498135 RepID=A0A4P6Q2D4_9ACTN|nr:PPOX class F420-dependent oxidoreductase [Streptomonospora litoralis]QBI52787.1 Pyridoxamine 5'-phosphate oxidase [Streptomonospora litoralis]
MPFTDHERAYLDAQHIGRLATTGPRGPQTRPVGFKLNTDGTVDIGGIRLSSTRKYRNIRERPDTEVSFIVDDLEPDGPGAIAPGWGRGVEIRGRAETLTDTDPPLAPGAFSREVIRIHPRRIISWNLDPAAPELRGRTA